MESRKATGMSAVVFGGLIDVANYYPTTSAVIDGLKKAGGTGGAVASLFLSPLFGLVVIVVGIAMLWSRKNDKGNGHGWGGIRQEQRGSSGVQVGGDVHGDVNLHAPPKSLRLKYSDRQSMRWTEHKRSLNLDNIATLVMVHPQFGDTITLAKQVGPSIHINEVSPEKIVRIPGSAAEITFPGGAKDVVGFGMEELIDFDTSGNSLKRVVVTDRTFCVRLESIREHSSSPMDNEYSFAISEE
jgi:hypothetical protein